jgi:hypothetical protein
MLSLNANRETSLFEFALDIKFNAAILTACRCILPANFDVSNGAPQTYEELVAPLDAANRMTVYSGGSELTIYGDLNLPLFDVSQGRAIMRPFFLPRQTLFFSLWRPVRTPWG